MIRILSRTAVVLTAILVGCGSSPKANFYTLSSDTAPAIGDSRTAQIIAISPIAVPEMLDRPQFVVRTGVNQVSINEMERWAGSLKSEIARALANNIATLVPSAMVYPYPQSASVNADCRILVDVQKFDSTPNESAQIEVLWTVQPAKGVARSGRSLVSEPTTGAGYDALVAAHSRALAAVSKDIAAAVRASGAQ